MTENLNRPSPAVMKLVNGPELLEIIKSSFSTNRRARLAVAFWGKGAVKNLGFRAHDDVQIVCNLAHSGTNPHEINKLISLGLDVRQHPQLHAKVGVVGSLAFVGSSNMSTNGLGDEDSTIEGWEEANVVFLDGDLGVGVRFEELWTASSTIETSDIDAAKERWRLHKQRRAELATRNHAKTHPRLSFIDFILDPQAPIHSSQVYIATHRTLTRPEEAAYLSMKSALTSNVTQLEGLESEIGLDLYIDWPSIPKGATLIDYRKPTHGMPSFDGCWYRLDEVDDLQTQAHTFQIVSRVSDVYGFTLTMSDKKQIQSAVNRYWKLNTTENGYLITMKDLANLIRESA